MSNYYIKEYKFDDIQTNTYEIFETYVSEFYRKEYYIMF